MQKPIYNKFFLIILGIICSAVFIWFFYNHKQIYQHNHVSSTSILSHDSYKTLLKQLLAIVDNQDPRQALSELTTITATNSAVLRSCHAFAHEIGHAAYQKYQDFGEAMLYKDEICNSGYMHGVIESRFYASKDVYNDMKMICTKYPLGTFLSWECYHGVGHGLMYYTANDLPKSLEMCDSLANSFAQSACANGVYMENFNTDQKLHPSKFLKKSNPFYPCDQKNISHRDDCYLYAPVYFLSFYPGNYQKTLEWCNTAENSYKQFCAQGIGIQAVKENINNSELIEAVCNKYPDLQQSCISGMINLYINHFGGLTEAKNLCTHLNSANKSTCAKVVEDSKSLF